MREVKIGEPILLHEIKPLDIITFLPIPTGKCLVYKVDNTRLYLITNIDNDRESKVKFFSKSNSGFGIIFEGSISNIKSSVISEVLERKFNEEDTKFLRFKDLRCGAKFSFEKSSEEFIKISRVDKWAGGKIYYCVNASTGKLYPIDNEQVIRIVSF